MAEELNPLQVAAGLAEMVYRRNINDQPLTIDDIGASDFAVNDIPTSLTLKDNGFYYDDSQGFVARVVSGPDGRIYVVLRGTDFGTIFNVSLQQQTIFGFDKEDLLNDALLGAGTTLPSQFDDALALTQAVIDQLGGDRSKVVVVGQSLGGGLAGLVSGVLNVESYIFDPAPFQNQFRFLAAEDAIEKNGLASAV